MKAAILHQLGHAPVYGDFSEPVPANDDQLVINVKAASVKNIDKLRASGTHYASYKTDQLPVIVGIDATGLLEDGTPVYAQGLTGSIAEKILVAKNRYTVLPKGIDMDMAAALPNAVMGAAMALHSRGNIQKGDVVLINGATGVTGQLAVQIARHYGASKIIATGRNIDSLQKIRSFGADITIPLSEKDETIIEQLKAIHQETPIDMVVDYLWGRPVELIIKSLKSGGVNVFSHPTKIITVGDMAGTSISLESGTLRGTAIQLLGSGLGSFSQQDIHKFNTEILPEMFQMAVEGKLTMEVHKESLKDIETAWNKTLPAGQRMVIHVS